MLYFLYNLLERWGVSFAEAKEEKHTPKRKKQEMTCAERPTCGSKGRKTHAKKKKARNDVCEAPYLRKQRKENTRQKEKSKK